MTLARPDGRSESGGAARRTGPARVRRGAAWDSRQEVVALFWVLGVFAVLARLSHAMRPALGMALALAVLFLARRGFHLGVSLYALTFPFLGLLPGRFLGVYALNPLNLMLATLLGFVLFRRVRQESEPLAAEGPSVLQPLIVWYGWLLVGVVHAWVRYDVPLGWDIEHWRRVVAVTVPIVFGAAVAWQGRRPRAFLAGSLLAAAGLLAIWGYLGRSADLAGGGRATERSAGRFGQPNSFGAFLALVLPGFVALAASGKGWKRWVGWAGTCLCGLNLLHTVSRGSILAGAVGFLVLTLLRHRGVLVGALVVMLSAGSFFVPDHVVQRFEKTWGGRETQGGLDRSAYLRMEMYRLAPRLIRESPLIGHGFGAFPWAANAAGEQELARSSHSFYIELMAETGAVGAVLFLWLFAAIARALWRRLRRASQPLDAPLAAAALGATAALAVVCLFQNPFTDNEMILPFYSTAVGLAVGGLWRAPAAPRVRLRSAEAAR